MSSIGKKIRHLRREKNLTQEELAKKVGTSRAVVANWEIGRAQPDLDMLCTLADTFQLTVDNLLGRISNTGLNQWNTEANVLLAEKSPPYQATTFSSHHQEVLAALMIHIGQRIHRKSATIFPFPFSVYLPLPTEKQEQLGQSVKPDLGKVIRVQPDLTIISNCKEVHEQGFYGIPDWILEIISPETLKEDMQEKLSLYEQAGVPEYWIVHPTEQTVLVFRLQKNGKYGRYQFYTAQETIRIGICKELHLNLKDIF